MEKELTTYTKVRIGSGIKNQIRVWLTGTNKQIVAELGAKGFEVLTKRPSRAQPKAEKVAKPKKAKKAAKKAKEPVAA